MGGVTVEELILAELRERRREHRARLGHRAEDGPGMRRFVPPVSTSTRDLSPTQLADLLTYLDQGYLRIVLPGEAA